MAEQPVPAQGQDGTNTDLGQDRAHSARMYDYYLGGKTNYVVDREAAQEVIRVFPAIETVAKVNRAYMHRAVRYLARQGIRQFIDVGTGIPTSPNLHDVAQEVAPDCRVVYVDNDPIVLVYADELLDGTPEGRTAYVQANATKPDEVWAAVRERNILDPELPVALSLHALMHFVTDSQEPYEIVRSLLEPLPPGSYLSLSHCTGEFDPEAWQAIIDTYAEAGTSVQVRGRTEVRRFFDGLELVDPGVVLAHQWHPRLGSGPGVLSERQVSLYAGVARKP
ncbi:SAM-dependent methyltransferase [Streptomyces sp. SID4946]|uniref:SAM-dependent methyltransferase n=1 Tax=Streptomyces griseofuscus TaxID=146922 RepID=UPI000B243C09|nr:SAM-dependent methyltransferase [Streptomyces griseofuscus]MBJ6999638.1 SAM-dependent methyltransferase [Streptomyces sp. CRPSP2-6A1]MYQ96455.1 SAM-dependent methyltransferase [Streptomyces sp. SID4946]MYR88201.1 SAM-dependent methyltransferase [Streptomyces sp. SID685]